MTATSSIGCLPTKYCHRVFLDLESCFFDGSWKNLPPLPVNLALELENNHRESTTLVITRTFSAIGATSPPSLRTVKSKTKQNPGDLRVFHVVFFFSFLLCLNDTEKISTAWRKDDTHESRSAVKCFFLSSGNSQWGTTGAIGPPGLSTWGGAGRAGLVQPARAIEARHEHSGV